MKKEIAPKQEKKAYVRPQLAKHGNVEALTQGQSSGDCGPSQIFLR